MRHAQRDRIPGRQEVWTVLLTTLLWLPASTLASTIAGMSIDDVASDAELIFEGTVVSHDSQRESGSGLIHTYVTFAVNDVIKGSHSAATLELRFTGGEANGELVEVSGLTIPAVGEQGIYFVESTSRALLNPLLGWSQGHFLIVEDEGERRVNTAASLPVTEIQPVRDIPATLLRPQALIEGKSQSAAGIVTGSSALSIERALTVQQFKNRIQQLLE